METAFEWHPIIMGRFIMSVGMFQHMSDICVTCRLGDMLIRKITHCAEFTRYPIQITKFTTAAGFTKLQLYVLLLTFPVLEAKIRGTFVGQVS